MRFLLFCALWVAWLLRAEAQPAPNTPKPLLIYYGYPAKINGLTTAQAAATAFSQYAYVVWPDPD